MFMIAYGVMSIMIGMMALSFSHQHRRIMLATVQPPRLPNRQQQGAPPDTINFLETRTYGDVLGKVYQRECAICLEAWEPSDRVKVMPCQHAFHEECLASWLRRANTCAICRLDIVSKLKEDHSSIFTRTSKNR